MLIRLNWVLSTNRVDRLIQDWRLVHMGFRVAAGCAAQSFTCACTYSTFEKMLREGCNRISHHSRTRDLQMRNCACSSTQEAGRQHAQYGTEGRESARDKPSLNARSSLYQAVL